MTEYGPTSRRARSSSDDQGFGQSTSAARSRSPPPRVSPAEREAAKNEEQENKMRALRGEGPKDREDYELRELKVGNDKFNEYYSR